MLSLILLTLNLTPHLYGFLASNNAMNEILSDLNEAFDNQLGYVSRGISHQEILKSGLHKSIKTLMKDLKIKHKFNAQTEQFEYDVDSIKLKSRTRPFCRLTLKSVLDIMLTAVSIVDTDSRYKNLPWAHYDAETFEESTKRVRKFLDDIERNINEGDLTKARVLIGQVLHTIQDFYSHSNWIEMGKTDINYGITTQNDDYDMTPVATQQDQTCFENCTLVRVPCDENFYALFGLANKLAPTLNVKCPLSYFKCEANVILDKLTSGYYGDQSLPNGTQVPKPSNKCSHGGLLDSTSFKSIQGGINKDTGYYFFSPHAQYHSQAVKLATKHTEFLFNFIRKSFGKAKFIELLGLNVKHDDSLTCLGDKLIFMLD